MKLQSYTSFWQHIHKSAKKNSFPLRVMFELTYRCNFKCKHCYVPQSYRKKRELKTKEVFSILDQLADIGCFYLGFTGGEPFIRKDIMDILWYAKSSGFEIIIYTNGSLINKLIAKQLSLLRPNKVDITIPGMSRLAFERITGIFGSRDKVFKAVDLLHGKGVSLGFKTCVLKENEKEINQIQSFAHSLGALHRLDDMLLPRLDGSGEPYKYRGRLLNNANPRESNVNSRESLNTNHCQSKLKLREYLNDDISANSRAISGNSRLFKCGVGVSQVAITPLGELKMCLMIDYPKYKILDRAVASCKLQVASHKSQVACQKSGLQKACERLKDLVASIKPDEDYKCNQCQLEPYCKWCPAQAWLENKSFTTCGSESRYWAYEVFKK